MIAVVWPSNTLNTPFRTSTVRLSLQQAAPAQRRDVLSLDDLKEGMVLTGTVRNVVDFGAFVDIGVKQDGLVHVSQMAEKFVRNPHEVVRVGDVVQVRVVKIDKERGRVGLSMRV